MSLASYNATQVTVTEVAMKFYDRQQELDSLEELYRQCKSGYGKIAVVTGRRRVGKTLLAKKFAEGKTSLYFFISKKTESLLCDEFILQYESCIGQAHIGRIQKFIELFELILKYGRDHPCVLIIDEFQEFYTVNPGIYSEIQNKWDEYKFQTKVHVVFIGSIYSLMVKTFQNAKEPLFGRADRILYIKPFEVQVMKTILEDRRQYSNENLLYTYMVTGGVPRYLELLWETKSFTKQRILDQVFKKDSFFIEEGKNSLVLEFGKDYGTYFSILELLSVGRTSRSEIESVLERSCGGYLERLEREYDVVEKVKPLGSKRDARNQKYRIKDNFTHFWFRFVNRYMTLIQGDRFGYLRNVIDKELSSFCGTVLEKLFIEIKGYSNEYGLIGTYWERGNKNEIDIVSVNEIHKKICVTEVKMNKDKINLHRLRAKTANLETNYPGYEFEYEGLALEDISLLLESMP